MMGFAWHQQGHSTCLLKSALGADTLPVPLGSHPGPATLQLCDPGKFHSFLVSRFPLLQNGGDSDSAYHVGSF